MAHYSFHSAAANILLVLKDKSEFLIEKKKVKSLVMSSYNNIGHIIHEKAFMNWGLWDKKLSKEYNLIEINFSGLSKNRDNYSQLLNYYIVRPLVFLNYTNKVLLDIGCGNGVGLRMNSQLLKTRYALGIDITNKVVLNAKNQFKKKNEIEYIQADAENLPIKSNSIDIITNLESSHLYPSFNLFLTEVERVLVRGGFFCYADFLVDNIPQSKIIEQYVKSSGHFRIILKKNISSKVRSSIFNRLIVNENIFCKRAKNVLFNKKTNFTEEFISYTLAGGALFLPRWKRWFKNPILKNFFKTLPNVRNKNNKYFYYLIQKV